MALCLGLSPSFVPCFARSGWSSPAGSEVVPNEVSYGCRMLRCLQQGWKPGKGEEGWRDVNYFENWKHFFEVAPEANCQARSLRLMWSLGFPAGVGTERLWQPDKFGFSVLGRGRWGRRLMGKADEGIAEDVCRGGLEANCTYGPRWGGGDRGMCGCKHVSVPQCTLFEVFVLPCALTLLLPTSHNLSANVLIIIKELFILTFPGFLGKVSLFI